MMRKLKIVVEYDGTRYHGWQVQPNGVTIQELLQNKLKVITKRKTVVMGSGRTDAGVHARAQVAHFSTTSKMTTREFLKALNSLLPLDVVVKEVEEVDSGFHAIGSASRKLYQYTVLNRDFPTALECRFADYVATPLNVPAMRRAAKLFLGEHDFGAFRAAGCNARNSIRTLYQCSIKKQGDYLCFSVEGNGFLKYMVRIIVGTLLEVGKGKMSVKEVEAILESKDRVKAGPTAPARGSV